uniref:uncharacterized protein n=1 Tax=Pristiophorus japonicus TaxID=55135 RepID=UPI00398E514E
MEGESVRKRAKPFSEEANEALVNIISGRWDNLTRGGHGKPPPRAYQKIWAEIADVITSASNEVRTPDQCRKRWNSLLAAARKKISINRAEQRRMGGCSAQVQILSEYEELAVALVGPDSCSVTTHGVVESTLESRGHIHYSCTVKYLAGGRGGTAANCGARAGGGGGGRGQYYFCGGGEQPAAISIETDEAPGPSGVQVVTSRREILQTPTPRRSGQRGGQSPTMEGQTESLISLCRETVAIGHDLIQGFAGFSANWSQFFANWGVFSTNFSNWSSVQAQTAREKLEAIRQQTAATNALRHALLVGRGAAPQGVVSARSETP